MNSQEPAALSLAGTLSRTAVRCWTWAITFLLWAGATTAVRAEDSNLRRWYFGFRASDSNPLAEVHDLWGASVGVNLNRYFGLELSTDLFEKTLDDASGGPVGELAAGTVLSQVRLRYPVFHDLLTPYLIGGVGAAFTQFNDRKPRGFSRDIHWDSETFVGTLGGGLDYFFADNLALNLEGRYLFAQKQDYQVDSLRYETDISGMLVTLGFRVFFPENRPQALVNAFEPTRSRAYLGVEFGGALPFTGEVYPGVDLVEEPPAKGPFDELVGARVGMDFNNHFGLELSVESFEAVLDVKDWGTVGEYAIVPVLLQGRYRYPLGDGHFCPYAIGGFGAAYTEFNDRKPGGQDLKIDAEGIAFAAGFGLGIEYFLASNFSLDLESKYIATFGQTCQVGNQPERSGDIHAFFASFGFRVYLFSFGDKRH